MALLPAEICAIDHSHKIAKHIARIDGVQVFTGLITLTTGTGEIRLCNLVASKAHDAFRHALVEMKHSLELYGHSQPKVFYTDNMADKIFLEEIFPSLHMNVTPVEKYAHLEPISLPPTCVVQVHNTTAAINNDIRKIFESLSLDGSSQIVVGFDSEWNVEGSPYELGSTSQGTTAVIQIAHENNIYIFQISSYIATKQPLPHQLHLLLTDPNVLKVRRRVGQDLSYLEMACQSTQPFLGGVDLGSLAKERNLIRDAHCSLSDLCGIILKKCLPKNLSEWLSTQWENDVLTNDQIKYAAQDAYVSLILYDAITHIAIPSPLSPNASEGFPVIVYDDNQTSRVIAYGHIVKATTSTISGAKVLNTRKVICITHIIVPGAKLYAHGKKPLSSFGAPPFNAVVIQSHLREWNSRSPPIDRAGDNPTPNTSQHHTLPPSVPPPSNDLPPSTITNESQTSLFDVLNWADPDVEETLGSALSSDDVSTATPTLATTSANLEWSLNIRSRVLKDPFHVFKMIYIPRGHGLAREFACALRDAIFLPEKEDKTWINAWAMLLDPPISFEHLKRYSPKRLWQHCRRVIPPSEVLYPLVEKVFETFGKLKDAQTGQELFNSSARKVTRNILALIRDGYLSDPPDVPLYTIIDYNKHFGNLPIYRCARGTNQTEEGVHTHLRPCMPTSGASVSHFDARIADFTLRHNLLVGTYNTTGKRYQGHFDIWLINELEELLIHLEDVFTVKPLRQPNWVNGNLYIQTREVSGILPIPSHIREKYALINHIPSLDSTRPLAFLASRHGTQKPVLPIHGEKERNMFKQLMRENQTFNTTSPPKWEEAAVVWNRLASDSSHSDISYKLPEHLALYYSSWKTSINIRESLSRTTEERRPLQRLLADPTRATHAPTTLVHPQPQHNVIQTGYIPFTQPAESPSPQASTTAATLTSPAFRFGPSSTPAAPAAAITEHENASHHIAKKRAAEIIESRRPQKKPRRPRHCGKCGRGECEGSHNRARCLNPCQDCGRIDCKGRDLKNAPKKPCENRR